MCNIPNENIGILLSSGGASSVFLYSKKHINKGKIEKLFSSGRIEQCSNTHIDIEDNQVSISIWNNFDMIAITFFIKIVSKFVPEFLNFCIEKELSKLLILYLYMEYYPYNYLCSSNPNYL